MGLVLRQVPLNQRFIVYIDKPENGTVLTFTKRKLQTLRGMRSKAHGKMVIPLSSVCLPRLLSLRFASCSILYFLAFIILRQSTRFLLLLLLSHNEASSSLPSPDEATAELSYSAGNTSCLFDKSLIQMQINHELDTGLRICPRHCESI